MSILLELFDKHAPYEWESMMGITAATFEVEDVPYLVAFMPFDANFIGDSKSPISQKYETVMGAMIANYTEGDLVSGNYLIGTGNEFMVFSTAIRNKDGHKLVVDLFNASSVVIKRHILIKGDATPYDPAFIDYFKLRNSRRKVGRIKTRGHVTWSGSTLKAKRYVGGWLGHPVA